MKNETKTKIKVNIEIDEYDLTNVLTTLEVRISEIEDMFTENKVNEDNKEMFAFELDSLNKTIKELVKIYNDFYESNRKEISK